MWFHDLASRCAGEKQESRLNEDLRQTSACRTSAWTQWIHGGSSRLQRIRSNAFEDRCVATSNNLRTRCIRRTTRAVRYPPRMAAHEGRRGLRTAQGQGGSDTKRALPRQASASSMRTCTPTPRRTNLWDAIGKENFRNRGCAGLEIGHIVTAGGWATGKLNQKRLGPIASERPDDLAGLNCDLRQVG